MEQLVQERGEVGRAAAAGRKACCNVVCGVFLGMVAKDLVLDLRDAR